MFCEIRRQSKVDRNIGIIVRCFVYWASGNVGEFNSCQECYVNGLTEKSGTRNQSRSVKETCVCQGKLYY